MSIAGRADRHWVALVPTQVSAAPEQELNNPAGSDMVGFQWSLQPAPEAEVP